MIGYHASTEFRALQQALQPLYGAAGN